MLSPSSSFGRYCPEGAEGGEAGEFGLVVGDGPSDFAGKLD
jgi:hypothetical protein